MLGVVALVLVLALLFGVSLYNHLILLRNGTDNAFGTIDVQLKQRCDLIPKVVDAVRGYMSHEQGVPERLTELRARATAADTLPAERLALDGQMSGLAHNTSIETVPANIVAGAFGFSLRPLFEASAEERAVPGIGSLGR